jgi:hypothetical protein
MVSGCAWTTAVRIDPNAPEHDGFVYYECKPLVVVSGATVSVQYVKNPNKAYAVRFNAFLSKNHVQITFDKDCGLTEVDSNIDTTAIIPLLQDVVGKLLPNPSPASGTGNNTVLQIYDVVFDDFGSVVELRPLIKSKNLVSIPAADQ